MEEAFNIFYRALDRSKFKYFIRDDSYYVHNNDIELLPSEMRPKNGRSSSIKIQNIEPIIKDMLVVRRIPVEEYKGYKLTKMGYPGDYKDFMDICIDDTIVPTIFAVSVIHDAKVQVAFIRDSKIRMAEYEDDDLFSHLFSLMSANNCIEVLYNDPTLERVFNGWGIPGVLLKYQDCSEMIMKYLKIDLDVEKFDRKDCCLLNIKDFDLADFELSTKQGKRLLNQWIRSPSIDIEELEKRLDMSECFSSINVDVGAFIDLKRIISKISTRKMTIQETIKIVQTIEQIPKLIGSITNSVFFTSENISNENRANEKAKKLKEDFISPLESIYNLLVPLTTEIRQKINFDQERINPNLTEELLRLENMKIEIYKDIENEYLKTKKELPRVKFSNKCFKITRSEYNSEKFNGTGYLIVSLLKTGVYFTTKTLSACKERLDAVTGEISTAGSFIFDQIRSSMVTFVNSLDVFNYVISLIDIYKGFSVKARSCNYSRPVFNNSRYCVEGLFHPMLENKGCILNDIDFKKDVCILTGPNMGGKSTFMKSLSMISLYAQIGCYVPAKNATLPIFDRIFLRVGAKDYSSQKLSTFMVEMVELNRILRTATPNSLVLIDELGRGTSAIDGLSIVTAVKEYLVKLGAKTVMASHFSELGDECTLNKKMSVMGSVLTYKIEDGICDTSFGINVAELAKFPEEVVNQAKEYLNCI